MKALAKGQWVFSWYGVYPINETIQWRTILMSITFVAAVSAMGLICSSSSAVFFLKYMSIDLELSLYALFQVAATLMLINAIIIILLSRHKIAGVFKSLENIYQTNRNTDLFQFLVSANEQSQRIWNFFLKYVLGGFFLNTLVLSAFSVVISKLKMGHFDTKRGYLPYKIVLPWNQQTPIGYFYELIIDIFGGESYWISIGSLLLLFISINLHYRAFYNMFRHMLQTLNFSDKSRNDKHFLCELIQFHKTAKEWFLETSDLYSPYIAVQLISSMLMLSCSIFQIDLELKHIDYNISILLMAAASSALNLFVYCFYGKMATESFLEMAECLFESNWQCLPVHLQKYFILLIQNAQRPLYYNGYSIIILNLETFTRMIKTVMTYYMMFKTITND